MDIKNIIKEEIDDWDWAKEINPIPYEIINIGSQPSGRYKIWLGDVSIDFQLIILNYLINLIDNEVGLQTSSSLESIRSGILSGRLDVNSLYFDIRKNGNKKQIIISMMAWYPTKDTTITRDQSLENGLIYFNGSNHKDLRKVSISESNQDANDDMDWIKEIPGTKKYGEKYRYFEVIACYGVEPVTEECVEAYSHIVRISIDVVDELWDGHINYMGGPGDEGEGIINYVIENGLISSRELEEIIMFEGVVEVDEDTFGYPDIDAEQNYSQRMIEHSDPLIDDLGWMDDTFQLDESMLDKLLKDCNDIKISNINKHTGEPYTRAGKPSITYLSRCKDWWDKFESLPLDDDGRGKGEWFPTNSYKEGTVAVIWTYSPDHPKNIDINKVEAITMSVRQILRYLNGGTGEELYFMVDDNNRPIYGLIPKEFRELVKTSYDDYFFSGLNESEFEWAEDIDPFTPYIGMKWKAKLNKGWGVMYEITSLKSDMMSLKWTDSGSNGLTEIDDYSLDNYWGLVNQNRVKIVNTYQG